jgi:hypothetical protein
MLRRYDHSVQICADAELFESLRQLGRPILSKALDCLALHISLMRPVSIFLEPLQTFP